MKKIGIMQPYFFPYIGYFSLIKQTDEFILFDAVQFIRHGWIERNRILKQNESWLYIKVPLIKHEQSSLIKDVLIDQSQEWKNKIMAQLVVYKKIAPYYETVVRLIENIISKDCKDIVALNKIALEAVCHYLEINTPIKVFSEMSLDIETPHAADEWALNICKAISDIDEYWNPPGGEDFFDRSKYEQAGIKLIFQKIMLEPYNQYRQPFVEGLSI
ncbi:MAG TPA: WbqC family protein, partial [Candidatus Saccharimonadales bacterium]